MIGSISMVKKDFLDAIAYGLLAVMIAMIVVAYILQESLTGASLDTPGIQNIYNNLIMNLLVSAIILLRLELNKKQLEDVFWLLTAGFSLYMIVNIWPYIGANSISLRALLVPCVIGSLGISLAMVGLQEEEF